MRHLHFIKANLKKVLALAFIIAGCYLFFATAFVVVALAIDNRRGETAIPAPAPRSGQNVTPGGELPEWFLTGDNGEEDQGTMLRPPARTNFILMGIDNFSLADAIMVGTFYRDTGDVHLMSVPRDTYIHLSDARHAYLLAAGLNLPRQLRINELRSLSGSLMGRRLIREEAGAMFGVHFHYYVEVSLGAFRRIVDDILGGIYFDVPRRLFYEDPAQNLVIDVPAGHRRLTGTQAEGLVRYRSGYGDGDLGRNQVQMQFMTALIQQVMTREALMANPTELLRIISNEVYTNIPLTDMPRYLRYIPPIAPLGEIRTFTMPGGSAYRANRSVFVPDMNQLHIRADEVFRAQAAPNPGP